MSTYRLTTQDGVVLYQDATSAAAAVNRLLKADFHIGPIGGIIEVEEISDTVDVVITAVARVFTHNA